MNSHPPEAVSDRARAMLELAERCENASGPDWELDAAIHEAVTTFPPRRAGVGWPNENALVVPAFPGWVLLPAYTASLDAAMGLVPEGWRVSRWEEAWRIGRWHAQVAPRPSAALLERFDDGRTIGWETADTEQTGAATPALALTAACLRALASPVDGEGETRAPPPEAD